MSSINVLTINEELKNKRDLVKIVEDARNFFPTETWNDIRYLGKLCLEHDFRIATSEESLGAFRFQRLTKRIEEIKEFNRLKDLLLGVTPDPIVLKYYFFDGNNFRRALYLVHDYVLETVGVVSLYRLSEGSSSKVVAHGLGHSKGLSHHQKPIDLMYSELLRTPTLQVEGFCEVCLNKLARNGHIKSKRA